MSKYRIFLEQENQENFKEFLKESSTQQYASETLSSLSAGLAGVMGYLMVDIDDKSEIAGNITQGIGSIFNWDIVSTISDYFLPFAAGYTANRLFSKIIGESININENTSVTDAHRQTWLELQDTIHRRDDILQEITKQRLSEEEAAEMFGRQLQQLTNQISELARELEQFLSNHTSEDLGISSKEYRNVYQYVQKAKYGLVSNYLANAIS